MVSLNGGRLGILGTRREAALRSLRSAGLDHRLPLVFEFDVASRAAVGGRG